MIKLNSNKIKYVYGTVIILLCNHNNIVQIYLKLTCESKKPPNGDVLEDLRASLHKM